MKPAFLMTWNSKKLSARHHQQKSWFKNSRHKKFPNRISNLEEDRIFYRALTRGDLLKFSQFQESLSQGEFSEERLGLGNLNFIERDSENSWGLGYVQERGREQLLQTRICESHSGQFSLLVSQHNIGLFLFQVGLV